MNSPTLVEDQGRCIDDDSGVKQLRKRKRREQKVGESLACLVQIKELCAWSQLSKLSESQRIKQLQDLKM